MPSNVFFMILALLVIVMVVAQVRNQKMKEKYAALWLVISILIAVLAMFPHLLFWLAEATGVVMPVNLLFLLSIIMLIGVALHLTLEVSKLSEDTRTLAEEIAILKARFNESEARNLQSPSQGSKGPEQEKQ